MTTSEQLRSMVAALHDRRTRYGDQYAADPERWLNEVIRWPEGEAPTEYQIEVLMALVEHRRVAVRAPRGSGKTAPASWATLWFATTRDGATDWKVPTTAGSWLQLGKFLWPEIHKWARRIDWSKLGREPLNPRSELLQMWLKLRTGEAFAINSDTPDLLEGAHAHALLAIVDEGKAVPEASWDAIEGYFSDPGDKMALALSVPGAPAGRFYDIHARAAGYEDWHPIHVTVDRAIAAGRISPQWVEQRRQQWGEESPLFQNHVLAEFGGTEDGVIPLAWIEAAVERWRNLETMPRVEIVGADIADTGGDDTVLALRGGDTITEVVRFSSGDTMTHADRIANRVPKGGHAVVDSIGVGAGVHARLRQLGVRSVGFVASAGTKRRDASGQMRFINKRAAAWWNMREILEPPSRVCLPDDGLLLGELAAPTWREMAGGKIAIESKAEIRKRIGRSTDTADAVIQAFYADETTRLDLSAIDEVFGRRASPNRP